MRRTSPPPVSTCGHPLALCESPTLSRDGSSPHRKRRGRVARGPDAARIGSAGAVPPRRPPIRPSGGAVADSVALLTNDPARFGVDHYDYSDCEIVGDRENAFRASLSAIPKYRSDIYESALEVGNSGDLINGIRETSRAMQATSWDDWW